MAEQHLGLPAPSNDHNTITELGKKMKFDTLGVCRLLIFQVPPIDVIRVSQWL